MNAALRYPGGYGKAFTLSYDDAVRPDKTLIELMREYGVKGTFNLNSGLFSPEGYEVTGSPHQRLSKSEAKELYSDPLVEVAVHSLTHPWLERQPEPVAVYEMLQDRRNLEEMFGPGIIGMAYPYGTYSDKVIAAAKSVGLCYSRTVEAHHQFRLPQDWLRWGATCHHNDSQLFTLLDGFTGGELRDHEPPWLFYLWGHSYEFETDGNWPVMREALERVSSAADIWFATNGEIYRYLQAYNRLEYSADGRWVNNPSALPVCIQLPGGLLTIEPGHTEPLEAYPGGAEKL